MRSINLLLCAAAVFGLATFADTANAQWGRYRVTSSFSLPSVPYYAYQPVIQPAVAYSPVVVNQPVVVSRPVIQPAVAYSPVVVNQPVVVSRPVVPAVVVRRGIFRRPVVVTGYAPPAGVVYPAPAPVQTYYAPAGVVNSGNYPPAPSVVLRPTFIVP